MVSAAHRSLCIVSRDPVQCSELVLSLQSLLDPHDEVEIVTDRRRMGLDAAGVREPPAIDRRSHPDIDLAVRTKGFAIVSAAPSAGRSVDQPDAEDRARFENILSFKRRHDSRTARIVVGAASAVAVALILTPALNGFSDRTPRDAGPTRAPAVVSPTSEPPAAGTVSSREPNRSATRLGGGRPTRAHPSSFDDAIDTYTARVGEATERVIARAKRLIDRFKGNAIVRAPRRVDSESTADPASISSRPRIADSP
jgi:hypothetical protein